MHFQKWGTRYSTPTLKIGGTRTPRTLKITPMLASSIFDLAVGM